MSRVIVRPSADTRMTVACEPERHLVRAHQPQRSVVLTGVRGRPGRDGHDAGSSMLRRQCGEALSALAIVYEINGLVYALDPSDGDHIDLLLGITMTAGSAGIEIEIRQVGVINDTSWAWTSGRIWLGPGGRLTQTPPADGFDVLIGTALSATRVSLNIQDSIELE